MASLSGEALVLPGVVVGETRDGRGVSVWYLSKIAYAGT
jgi:hypothetical protein